MQTDAIQVALLPGEDAPRLHLQHGPIDLLIGMSAPRRRLNAAYRHAARHFETVLPTLVDELPMLNQARGRDCTIADGPIATRMCEAADRISGLTDFITPMIAVAGAVADDMLEQLLQFEPDSVWVNNGGDIALYTAPGAHLKLGLMSSGDPVTPDGVAHFGDPAVAVRVGVATSGWRGRSWSFGIADAVTTLCDRAVDADACATLIANAVNVEHSGIQREPASSLTPVTDLGERLVTVSVPELSPQQCDSALDAGARLARKLQYQTALHGATLSLQGVVQSIGSSRHLATGKLTKNQRRAR